MPTTPEQVRTGLELVTSAAVDDVVQVAGSYADPQEQTNALFVATPLIVSSYLDGSSALALDWFEDLREVAPGVTTLFVPEPVTHLREDYIGNVVGWATKPLLDLQGEPQTKIDIAAQEMLARLTPEVQKEVASGFRDTITQNTDRDPAGVGWQRFTQGADSCGFCRLLADKGAIYRSDTVNFAAHTDCHCVARPVFGKEDLGPEADVMQYVASKRSRTPAERKALREYIKRKYG